MSAATVTARGLFRGVRALPTLPPKLRRRLLIGLAIVLVLAAGYRLWVRDSAFVSVEKVTVTGLTTKDAARVRAALTSAAHGMTTLHVRMDDLEQAIAAYPVVRTLDVRTDFPHGLTIHVVEHRPAALVNGVAVAGDGTILRGLPVDGRLPRIAIRSNPHGNRLTQPTALHAARIAGGAPAALRPRLELIELRGQDGLVIQMREGPELIFGDARHVRRQVDRRHARAGRPRRGGRLLHRRPAAGPPCRRRATRGDRDAGRAGRDGRARPAGHRRAAGLDHRRSRDPAARALGAHRQPRDGPRERSRHYPPEHRAAARPHRFHRGGRRLGTSRVTLNPNLSFTQTLEHG